jgi:hypothetical protein
VLLTALSKLQHANLYYGYHSRMGTYMHPTLLCFASTSTTLRGPTLTSHCLFCCLPLCCTWRVQAAEADKLLAGFQPSSSSSAEEAARPTLLRAQLALEAGNAAAALQLLGSGLPAELQMRPAVLATRVALHEQVSVRAMGCGCQLGAASVAVEAVAVVASAAGKPGALVPERCA